MFKPSTYLRRAGIYEVNLRQYTPEGSFGAFARHLPRLKEMGVDIFWLMPIHPIGELRRKGELGSYYSIRDFEKVNPEFGTEDELRSLIGEIHKQGMKVIIDWVANHTACDHKWTLMYPDFYVKDDSGGFLSPYDWSDVIQLDHGNTRQQDAMISAMLYWIREFDIDGFRADLAHLTPLAFWKKARQSADAIKPDLVWLAESEDPDYHEAFDISFTWKWMHASEKVCKGEEPVSDLLRVLEDYRTGFPPDAFRLFFTSNHDENSWNGTEFEKYGPYARLLSIFSFLYNSVPLVYSGQEIPNENRLPFFHHQSLQWPEKPLLHDFYRQLFELRHKSKALEVSDNSIAIPLLLQEEKVITFYREGGDEILVVVLNFSPGAQKICYPAGWPAGFYEEIFSGRIVELYPGHFFNIDPAEGLVLKLKRP